jgi:hypothetical protein
MPQRSGRECAAFDKSDETDLLAEGKRFFREGEDDAPIGVESIQGGSHGTEFRFQQMIFKIEFGLDAWDVSITAN